MKKIIIAPDSFKESLSAAEVAEAIEAGILNVNPGIRTIKLPMADGGEGTLAAVRAFIDARKHKRPVNNAVGRAVEACWLQLADQRTAMIEVAQAAGLEQLKLTERNPLITSSFGVGQQIRQALDAGNQTIIITLGGSATNDCGAGLLQALGADYLDAQGQTVHACGGNLNRIRKIDLSNLDSRLTQADIRLLCDVSNPLCGDNGASAVFAPQKGAREQDVARLDANLKHFSRLLEKHAGKSVYDVHGAGAAGGIPAALLAATDAGICSGIDYLLTLADFSKHLSGADRVITGEGKIDSQTLNGKVIAGICGRSKAADVPVIALGGCVDISQRQLDQLGLSAAFSICNRPMTLKEAFQQTKTNLIKTTESIIRLLSQKKPE